MTDDPTREEMLDALADTWNLSSDEEGEDNAVIAMRWFANDYHGGQDSNLYSVLSTSPYNPGPCVSGPDEEGDMVVAMYDDLEQRFAPASTDNRRSA